MTENRTEEVRINDNPIRTPPLGFVVSEPLLYCAKMLIKVLAYYPGYGSRDITAEARLAFNVNILIPETYARYRIEAMYEADMTPDHQALPDCTDTTPDDQALPDCTDMRRDELVSIIAEGVAKGLKMALGDSE